MQGHLYKDKKNKSLFFQNQLKRYFVLDHKHELLFIYSDTYNYKLSDQKKHKYEDIIGVEVYDDVFKVSKGVIQKRFTFDFIILTRKREYRLFAASSDERKLWLHTFMWIVAKNSPIQIMFKE